MPLQGVTHAEKVCGAFAFGIRKAQQPHIIVTDKKKTFFLQLPQIDHFYH